MANAFAEYLPHFGGEREGRFEGPDGVRPLNEPEPQVDHARLIAEAEERGRAAGQEAARAEFERQRADDLAQFEQRLADERQRWSEEEAQRLGEGMNAALAEIESHVIDGVGRVIWPFLEAGIRRRALDELTETLRSLLAKERSFKMQVSGPEDLIAHLWRRLASFADVIEYRVSDAPDVRATADDTVIETCIAAWTERLAQALTTGDRDG